MGSKFFWIFLFVFRNTSQTCPFENFLPPRIEILHQWRNVDFLFPPWFPRKHAIATGKFIPENNVPLSLNVVNGDIYIAIRRESPATNYRDATGVPSTLNKVVTYKEASLLQPFPSLEDQTIGNCRSLQNVGNFKIDRRTGLLWTVDVGTVNGVPVCPAKLVVIDTKTGKFIRRTNFPREVFDQRTGFLNNIALDYVNGVPRYVYIADILEYKLIVYDFVKDKSWVFQHRPSMTFETCGSRIAVGNRILRSKGGINKLTITPDSKYLYYSPVAGFSVYQIPTFVLRNPKNNIAKYLRSIGEFPLQTFDFEIGKKCTYVSEVSTNTIKAWNRKRDIQTSGSEKYVTVETLTNVVRDENALAFADSLVLDRGYIYFLSNNLAAIRQGGNLSGSSTPKFIIGRLFVGEPSY